MKRINRNYAESGPSSTTWNVNRQRNDVHGKPSVRHTEARSEVSAREMMDSAAQFTPDPVREGVGTSGPGRNYPYDCWWVAAHGSELGEKPVLRWILDMPIVLYRTAEGEAKALHNRCPHRWAPLHLGDVDGENLVCPYHGMEFAPSGQCVKVPTQSTTPPAIRVRAYPLIERYGFLWVWTGAIELADPAAIPEELAYLGDPTWQHVWGYKSVNGNFMQMKENVLDLTHFAFLHKKSLGVAGWDRPPEVEVTTEQVMFRQKFELAPLPPVYAIPAGKEPGKLVDRDNWGVQLSPASHHGAVDMHDPDPAEGLADFKMRIVHLTTPVSIGKTHYYWAIARDHGPPYDYDRERGMADIIFGEDIAMVEAMQEMARCSIDQDEAKEYSVTADRAGIEGRRKVAALVAAENAHASTAGMPA